MPDAKVAAGRSPAVGVRGAGLVVTWLGHSTALIEIDGVRLLTDPVLGRNVGPLLRYAAMPAIPEGLDAVLLSHLHADHADVRSLRSVAKSTPIIAPAGAGAWLARKGLANAVELEPGESTRVGALSIRATEAAHDGQRWRYGHVAGSVGYLATGTGSCYFAGDTDLFEGMHELAGLDVALLPVAGWGPTLGPGHLDPERAATAAQMIEPRIAIPIHWGTLGLPNRRRPPREPAETFARLVAERAPQVEVRVLDPGERTVVEPRR